MSKTFITLLLATVSILTGCASDGAGTEAGGEETAPTTAPTSRETVDDAGAEEAVGSGEGETEEVVKEQPKLPEIPDEWTGGVTTKEEIRRGDGSLELWKDPRFQRRFQEGYLAESEIEPDITVKEREVMIKFREFMAVNQIDEAVAYLEANIVDASSATFNFLLGRLYFQQERLEPAVQQYQLAVAKYPKFRRAWRDLGLIYVRAGQHRSALPALTKVIELGGADALTYGLLGFSYSATGNSVAAERAYGMANLLDPATFDWKIGMARAYFEQRRFADAAALCGSMIEEKPDRTDLWLLQANAYLGMKEPMRAAENFELVDRLGKSTTATLFVLGDIYVNEKVFDLATDAYLKAIDKDDGSKSERAIRSAKILSSRNALEESGRVIEKVKTKYADVLDDKGRKDLLMLEVRIAAAEGANDKEAAALREIIEIDPLDGEALIMLGQYNKKKGNVEEAVLLFKRAANVEKSEADAKVRLAQLYVSQGKYQEALPLLQRAQAIKPRENIQEYYEQVKRAAKSR